MASSDGTLPPSSVPLVGDGAGADVGRDPSVPQTDDGVHYYFPVEITVVQKQAEVDEMVYHFPVEIAVVEAERALDVNAVADLALDKLAGQLESEGTGRS